MRDAERAKAETKGAEASSGGRSVRDVTSTEPLGQAIAEAIGRKALVEWPGRLGGSELAVVTGA